MFVITNVNTSVSFRACSILTTEDAENLEIAKSMWAWDQKQKYDLEWPKRKIEGVGRSLALILCPDSLLYAEKESGETRIQFWFPVYVTWCDTRTLPLFVPNLIRVCTAELLASPELQICLNRWVASSIAG